MTDCFWRQLFVLLPAVSKESALHFHQTVRTQIQTPVIKGKITVNGVFLFTLTFFFVGGKRKSICCVLEERCLDWMNIRDFFLDYRFNAVRSDVQRATKFDDGVPKLQREKASSLTRLPRLIFAQETVSLIVKYAKALKYPSPSICPSEEADLWRGYKGAAYLSKFLHKALIILLLFLYVMTFLILVREECSVTNCVKSVWRHSRQAGRWGT